MQIIKNGNEMVAMIEKTISKVLIHVGLFQNVKLKKICFIHVKHILSGYLRWVNWKCQDVFGEMEG